ncbi:MAG: DUF3990 domain-containing protein [Bifidobacteriaceae bacterium]|nr:DUF3990 domain-containing protein [Bifidobacteriaceae bacterium]
MRLFHGSRDRFDQVDLDKSRDRRDFGRGFYTTTIRNQAEAWAKSMRLRAGGSQGFVYEFSFEPELGLNRLAFPEMNSDWLEMVKDHRSLGGLRHSYDVVSGPVADDRTFRTIALYLEGDLTVEQAIQRLRHFEPNDQVSFHTSQALRCLTLVERHELGN